MLIFIKFSGVSEGADWRADERPVIDPSAQIIKKPGEVLSLKCSGSSPVAWDLQGYEVTS